MSGFLSKLATRFRRNRRVQELDAIPLPSPKTARPIRTPKHLCIICHDTIPDISVQAPCGHRYDISCMLDLVEASTREEALYPPRCCRQPIPSSSFEHYMSPALASVYAEKSIEFSTLKRVYCAKPACSRFLGPLTKGTTPHSYTCTSPDCETRTCSRCREEVRPHVLHSCHPDTANSNNIRRMKLNKKTGWMQCPGCGQMVELMSGCYHITCICKTQFCYRCGSLWKTCLCPRIPGGGFFGDSEHTLTPNRTPWHTRERIDQPHQDPPRSFTPQPWLLRSRPHASDGTKNAEGARLQRVATAPTIGEKSKSSNYSRRNVSLDETRSRGGSSSSTSLAHTHPGEDDDDVPPVPPPKPKYRRSAPARMKVRDSVVARGVEAQQRRTKQKVDLSARYIEENAATGPRCVPDGSNISVLDTEIDRLLRAVRDIPCRHEWTPEAGRHPCDGCYRIGSYLSKCSVCNARACTRCQLNRL